MTARWRDAGRLAVGAVVGAFIGALVTAAILGPRPRPALPAEVAAEWSRLSTCVRDMGIHNITLGAALVLVADNIDGQTTGNVGEMMLWQGEALNDFVQANNRTYGQIQAVQRALNRTALLWGAPSDLPCPPLPEGSR